MKLERENDMIKPTLHMNGTSAKELHLIYLEAMQQLANAIDAVRATAPHGRDYYPQGNDVILAASKEHKARMVALNAMHEQMYELAIHTHAKA